MFTIERCVGFSQRISKSVSGNNQTKRHKKCGDIGCYSHCDFSLGGVVILLPFKTQDISNQVI
jgi:hypothetical protein